MSARLKLAVLISGRGSNLQSLIDACASPDFPAEVSVVISNRPDAFGLERARRAGLPTGIVDHRLYRSRETFQDALDAHIRQYPVDLVCLAGFMRVLTEPFVSRWAGKLINIHPSLLPAYKGLDTHARVLADGGTQSGCTIHFVAPEVDAGEIILQKAVPVLAGDSPETLAARVLEQEHLAYPEAIALLADRMRFHDGE